MDSRELSEVQLTQPETVTEKYKAVTPSANPAGLAVDARRVPHGQGPCACCGPYSE
jgi:hypothetical protein